MGSNLTQNWTFFLVSISELCVLKQVSRGGATLLNFPMRDASLSSLGQTKATVHGPGQRNFLRGCGWSKKPNAAIFDLKKFRNRFSFSPSVNWIEMKQPSIKLSPITRSRKKLKLTETRWSCFLVPWVFFQLLPWRRLLLKTFVLTYFQTKDGHAHQMVVH